MPKPEELSEKVVGSNPSAGKDFYLKVSIVEHSNQLRYKFLHLCDILFLSPLSVYI